MVRRPDEPEVVPVTQFKAKCLAYVERVRSGGRGVVVTKRGQAVARLVPAPEAQAWGTSFGSLKGVVEIRGDIVHTDGSHLWNVMRGAKKKR